MNIPEIFEKNSIVTNLNAVEWHRDSGMAAVYPPLALEDFDFLDSQLNHPLPDMFKEFLLQTNGLFYKKLSLYGLPVQNSNMLDRSRLRPHSVVTANQAWRLKYNMSNDLLMIGSKSGWSENTGVFLSMSNVLTCANSQGVISLESFEHLFDWSQDA